MDNSQKDVSITGRVTISDPPPPSSSAPSADAGATVLGFVFLLILLAAIGSCAG